MSKPGKGEFRQFHTRFWASPFVDELDPSEKLLYMYMITSPQSNMEGVYRTTLKRIAFETGLERDAVQRIAERFEDAGQAGLYFDTDQACWVVVCQAPEHMNSSPQIMRHASQVYQSVPDEVMDYAFSIGYTYPEGYEEEKHASKIQYEKARGISSAKAERVFDRCGRKCVECGSEEELEIHHRVPVAEGGTHDEDNLETLCRSCHMEKHRKDTPSNSENGESHKDEDKDEDKDRDGDGDKAGTTAKPKKVRHEKTGKLVNPTRYENLVEQYGQETVDHYIERAANYVAAKGKKDYADYAAAAANYMTRDGVQTKQASRGKRFDPSHIFAGGPEDVEEADDE